MSRFDQNPFDEETERNPYSQSGPRGSASFFDSRQPGSAMTGMSSNRPSPLPAGSGSTFDVTSDVQFSPRALRKKQKELQSWEAALRQKEEELAKREDSLGIMTKNFPPFFPLIRNNIREDVPEYLQGLMFLGFWVWMGTMAALLYNLVPITATWVAGAYEGSAGFVNFFMALLYFIIGVPGSYFLWYSRLYYGMRKDSGVGMAFFFCGFTTHLLFFIFASISPLIWIGQFRGTSFAGVVTTIDVFTHGWGIIGIFYAIGAALFVAETTVSFVLVTRVLAYFRGTGTAVRMKEEAARSAALNSSVV
ncbi:hypothetical protein CLOP_g4268 [Closterium sp. NIES-67]|nr:hypothetical protein CLOP_g4268 [Closterium sp. NIES-67]